MKIQRSLLWGLLLSTALSAIAEEKPLQVSGVYPHLRMWNNHAEAGTGAVVPWQGSLWAITYAPHMPKGSTDKLYEISPDLEQRIFEGSVGGTPANRMIHKESNQLLIGPYLVDAKKQIRIIPPTSMFGRLTGTARHLSDPENMVYYATMEEGLYEVNVNTLEVKCFIRDGNGGAPKDGIVSKLPGYHGKGLYTSQGKLVYANNGDRNPKVRTDPTVESGALAQWFGEGDWQLVRRNQFTEVTGPGGIQGNENPDTDPIWAMGWDERSLLLALLEDKEWHYYRLPKGSHSYDGAHGWNTEWPRIREIGEDDLLATMHGTFWRFPASFSRENSAGIAPRSNYLKVVGDFCRWGDQLVIGCDDSAAGEFLNTRPFKAKHGAPLQSNSNLWFIAPESLDDLGPVIGRGSVWLRDTITEETPSDPYLFAGYDHRMLHLSHGNDKPVTFQIEVDREGNNQWKELISIEVEADSAVSHGFPQDEIGQWLRIKIDQQAENVTASFQYRNRDHRTTENDKIISGVATEESPAATTGAMRSLSYNRLGLVSASVDTPDEITYYEIDSKLQFNPVDDLESAVKLVSNVRQPDHGFSEDEASLLLIEDGERYRLPRSPDYSLPAETQPTERSKRSQQGTLESYMTESLTLGAGVKVSSTHENYEAKHAIDGEIRSDEKRWVSSSNDTATIEIDLGEIKSLRSVWVVSGWDGKESHVASDFILEYDTDGKWNTFPGGKVSGNRKTDFGLVLEKEVKTSRIRLRSQNAGYFRIYEIAAFDREIEVDHQNTFAGFGPARVCREVATERDLLNLHGTFYELPARNAQGLAKVRPIATHNLLIQDFCSHNGLLFFTGVDSDTESEHIFRSPDGKAAVWAGAIDDLWKLGKPRGSGGPWKNTSVKANTPSDRYLMTGYDRKAFDISVSEAATIRLEVDVDGTGLWIPYKSFSLKEGETFSDRFPEDFSAYWVRAVSDRDTTATVVFEYD